MVRLLMLIFLALTISGAPFAAAAQQAESGEHEGHPEHANEAAMVVGVTHEAEEGEDLFTIGGEYSRVLGPRWRVAGVGEHLTGPDAWVVVFPIGFRVWEGLWLTVGPGFEAVSRRRATEETHGVTPDQGNEAETDEEDGPFFLVRAGAAYVFELGSRYSLKAGAAVDWVGHGSETATAVVYGVAFGVGF